MSCFLPPPCLFCVHYHAEHSGDGLACDAFDEIPDAIFERRVEHTRPYPSDRGYRFQLDLRFAEEFGEVNQLRRAMGLQEFELEV